MSSKTTGIVLHVEIQVAPSDVPEFLRHLRTAYEHVTAEPECIFFDVSQSIEEPGLFRLVEGWNATEEWLETVQLKKEYYEPYVEATTPLWTKPLSLKIFEQIEGWVDIKPSAHP